MNLGIRVKGDDKVVLKREGLNETGYKNIILLLIGLGILGLLVWKMEIDFSLIYVIKRPHYIALAVFLMLLIPLITAFRMKYFLLSVGKNSPMKEIVTIEYINKFLYYVAPFKLNVPAKAVLLNKICDVKKSDSASVVTFEYGLDAGITLLIGFLGIFFFFRNFSHFSLFKIQYLIIITIGVITFFCIPTKSFDKLLVKSESIRFGKKVVIFILKVTRIIRETWATLIFNKRMYYILPIVVLMWGVEISLIEALFLSANYYVPLVWVLIVSTCGVFIGGITTIPGGLGIREATMVFLYSALGVPEEISVMVVLLSRLLIIIPIAIGYSISIREGAMHLINRSK
jgi:uncharacterized protein (TIRG00374 family)